MAYLKVTQQDLEQVGTCDTSATHIAWTSPVCLSASISSF